MISDLAFQSGIPSPPSPNVYSVKWMCNGSVLQERTYTSPVYREQDYLGATPTIAETDTARYDFTGWSMSDNNYNITYTAQFNTVNKYHIRWYNNGTLVQNSTYYAGQTVPTYQGTTPTRDPDTNYKYVFKEWSSSVSGNVTTYTAVYTTYARKTVIWKNGTTTLQTSYYYEGEVVPSYTGSTPTKAADTVAKYVFKEWSSSVSGNTTTYIAVFTEYARKTVIWMNGSTTLQTSYYYEGETEPTYTGSTPTKASTSTYRYTFSSWSSSVSGNTTTYTAQFTSTRYYTWERYNVVSGQRIGERTVRSSASGTPTVKNNCTMMYSAYISSFTDVTISASKWYNGRLVITTGVDCGIIRANSYAYTASDIKANRDSSGYAYAFIYPASADAFLDRTVLTTATSAPQITYAQSSHNVNTTDDYYLTCIKIKASSTGAVQSMSIVEKYVEEYEEKGTTKYSNVTSTSSTAYPSDGVKGSYWYVKIS